MPIHNCLPDYYQDFREKPIIPDKELTEIVIFAGNDFPCLEDRINAFVQIMADNRGQA
jgi:hypothetical protein